MANRFRRSLGYLLGKEELLPLLQKEIITKEDIEIYKHFLEKETISLREMKTATMHYVYLLKAWRREFPEDAKKLSPLALWDMSLKFWDDEESE